MAVGFTWPICGILRATSSAPCTASGPDPGSAKAEPARVTKLELPHRFRMRARISGHAVSRTCNLAASQNHTLTVSHFLFIFEEPISIIVEPSEKPGCEEIERSKYRDSGRSGKAPSEARDRGTRYGAISQPRSLKAPQNHNHTFLSRTSASRELDTRLRASKS